MQPKMAAATSLRAAGFAPAAAAVGKSCHGRRRMSGVANAQFGNHDATKSARLRTCCKMFLTYGALLGGDILTSAKL